MKVVTAASGRRDSYQIAIALYEANLLQSHVTDFYLPDYIASLLNDSIIPKSPLSRKLISRHSPSLPSSYVHSSRRLAVARLLQMLRPSLLNHWSNDQDPISWSALRIANQHNSAFLVHMGYAHHAFISDSSYDHKKGLVQYHPHIGESSQILFRDLQQYPSLSNAKDELTVDTLDNTNQVELDLSDLVICNSTFTANTCIKTGISSERIKVIPFGFDFETVPPLNISPSTSKPQCNFLYVGSGIHRKGLHHLLEAWSSANLSHSKLNIVCRYCDPQIQASFSLPPSVQFYSSVSSFQLKYLYSSSDVFVMPSLVEGFGYVYLEALAHGCFCLGTFNTGLPDIADPTCSLIIPAGDTTQLSISLQLLENRYFTDGFSREDIVRYAQQWTWKKFRSELAHTVQSHLLVDNY